MSLTKGLGLLSIKGLAIVLRLANALLILQLLSVVDFNFYLKIITLAGLLLTVINSIGQSYIYNDLDKELNLNRLILILLLYATGSIFIYFFYNSDGVIPAIFILLFAPICYYLSHYYAIKGNRIKSLLLESLSQALILSTCLGIIWMNKTTNIDHVSVDIIFCLIFFSWFFPAIWGIINLSKKINNFRINKVDKLNQFGFIIGNAIIIYILTKLDYFILMSLPESIDSKSYFASQRFAELIGASFEIVWVINISNIKPILSQPLNLKSKNKLSNAIRKIQKQTIYLIIIITIGLVVILKSLENFDFFKLKINNILLTTFIITYSISSVCQVYYGILLTQKKNWELFKVQLISLSLMIPLYLTLKTRIEPIMLMTYSICLYIFISKFMTILFYNKMYKQIIV